MKRRGVLILILLALIPQVFSIYEELAYSGTVQDGESVEIAGVDFEFKVDSVSSKVFIKIDTSGIIINSGECDIKNNFDICVRSVSFSYRNYTTYFDVYQAKIDVYQIKSTLDVTNSIKKNNILIDEETSVEFSFENAADIAAENVLATIDIPSNLLITNVEGCENHHNAP